MSGFLVGGATAVRDSLLRPHGRDVLVDVTARPRAGGRTGRAVAAFLAGVLVHSVLMGTLTRVAGVQYLGAALISLQVAAVWNVALLDRLVPPPSRPGYLVRLGRVLLVANALAPLYLGLLHLLVARGGLHQLEASIAALAAVFLLPHVLTSGGTYDGDAAGTGAARRWVTAWWRTSGATRLVLVVLLTALAFPATTATAWYELWNGSSAVPLLIPLATASGLLVSRLRASDAEPEVHDRQLDGLLAAGLLAAAAALLLVAPTPAPASFRLVATVAFLAAAATLLLGTRTAARARWALLLPLVAIEALTPVRCAEVAGAITGAAAALGVRLAGPARSPLTADLSWAGDGGTAVAGAALCVVIAALACFGPRVLALRRAALGIVAVTAVGAAVALGTGIAAGAGVGPTADVARLLENLLLALTVGGLAVVWSRRVRGPAAGRQHLPRGRYAVVGLTVAAVAFALTSTPLGSAPATGTTPVPAADRPRADR
ncbi:hypothetical protein ACU61A_28245 [Pseudonocardia sichuanensis]